MAKASDNLSTKPVIEPMILAARIELISVALKQLLGTGINENAIVILLHHETKIAQRDIRKVLSGLRDLKKLYCQKDPI
jgi:hypothetical protein